MNALMIIPTREEMEVIKWEAEILVSSGFLPKHIQKPQHAIAIMLKGRELGVSPWVALTKIHVIQGTPTVAPELMLALIYRSGDLEDMHVDSSETACTVTMKRKGKSPMSATFTMENAQKMNLAGKDNWSKQPAVMLKWRAVSACARMAFPDVIQGMYTHEEINPELSVNEEGELLQPPAYPAVVENGNGSSVTPPARPYSPEILLKGFEKKIKDKTGTRAFDLEALRGSFAGMCEASQADPVILLITGKAKVSDTSQDESRVIQEWLKGDKELVKAEIQGLLDWSKPAQSAESEPQPELTVDDLVTMIKTGGIEGGE